MIYVRQDSSLIPQKVLKAAESAQRTLETLPEEERRDYIRRHSAVWRGFMKYLKKMSYGKCWYSESPEVQSFFDVDHFRPKLEARRANEDVDEGYPWLAFNWENFRLAAQRSNRQSTNEESEELNGKGNWFPLLDGSPKACWDDRCLSAEQPFLLDPTIRFDVDLIEVGSDGLMCSSAFCRGRHEERVKRSIEVYGLNLPDLVSARKRVIRDIINLQENLFELLDAADRCPTVADTALIERHTAQLRRTTLPNSAYSKAARTALINAGLAPLCAQPEDVA